jgi:urea carboxylase
VQALNESINNSGSKNVPEFSSEKIVEHFSDAVAMVLPENEKTPRVVYRIAGDTYLLVEYGEMILDLNLTFHVYNLDREIKKRAIHGIMETAPGVRSLLIKYNCLYLPLPELLQELCVIERDLPALGYGVVPSRLIYLPIAYNDKWNREAVNRYIKSVRAQAPYLPDNMEFIARCNNLESVEKVIEYHLATQHMVLALGDVYLGAPCAVPLDPRFRLVVPKYNPARMWTPEGSVGIGGSYICIYPMESPGGYQLVGRTLPIWNTYQATPAFADAPWLLRPFDRIQFEAVTEAELEELRHDILSNNYQLRVEDDKFQLDHYNEFLESVKGEASIFKQKQREAALRWTEGY